MITHLLHFSISLPFYYSTSLANSDYGCTNCFYLSQTSVMLFFYTFRFLSFSTFTLFSFSTFILSIFSTFTFLFSSYSSILHLYTSLLFSPTFVLHPDLTLHGYAARFII